MVQGAPRTASVVERTDWCRRLTPDVSGLTHDERAALARHYETLGCMEHASVAAFVRFVLDLLGVGAPASLVGEATQALADAVHGGASRKRPAPADERRSGRRDADRVGPRFSSRPTLPSGWFLRGGSG